MGEHPLAWRWYRGLWQPLRPLVPSASGEKVTVSCEAVSDLPEFTLLYWLGNGSFVEKLHRDGAVSEGTVL